MLSSSAFYVVHSGRLRTLKATADDGSQVIAETGRGHSIGALELYLARPRADSVFAIRRSHVLQIQKITFKALAYNNPALAFRFSEVIAKSAPTYIEQAVTHRWSSNDDSTISTIAIVPVSRAVSAREFAESLVQAMEDLGLSGGTRAPIIGPSNVKKAMSAQTSKPWESTVLENYLLRLEESAAQVIYLAEESEHPTWSATCISHVSYNFMKAAVF
jgi:signal-transduction protein with cAMP-binding, CBS, and nucleotidyltransferase domain